MRFKYTLVYQILGLSISSTDDKVILLEDTPHSFRVFLSNNLDKHCNELDKKAVIRKMVLAGLGGKTFESHLEEKRKQRNNKYKTPPFLIIEIFGEDRSFILEDAFSDKGEYILSIQNETGDFRRENYQNLINSVLSSLCIMNDTFYKVNKIGETLIYYSDQGKPIYNMVFSAHGTGFSSKQMLAHDIEATRDCSLVLSHNEEFNTICRLLVQSMDSKSDPLLAYLSEWTALEVFVNKIFKLKKKDLIAALTEGGLEGSFKEEIGKDKYSKISKFKMICIYFNKQRENSDAETFKKLKDFRDKLFHGEEIDLNTLPTLETQNLLRKYLKLMLE